MLKKWKNIITALLASVLMSILLTGCGEDNAVKEKFVHIATGGTAGTYYPIGGAIGEILNKNISQMHASIQSTGGSVSNIYLLSEGDVELAIVQNDIAHYATNGTEMFKDANKHKFENLKGIASLYPEACQFVTLADKGINSIADLKGKKVAVGAEGSGAEANARQILESYGITYNDIDAQYLSFAAGAKALKEGTVDVAFLTAGYPTAAVQDIASNNKIKILSLDDELIKAVSEKYPFYTKTMIPKDTYNGLDEDVQTVSVMAILICNTDRVDEELGYQITKSIFTNLDTLKTAHSAIANLEAKTATEAMPVDMQKGADKFFKESK